jgi:hypothetical protein
MEIGLPPPVVALKTPTYSSATDAEPPIYRTRQEIQA